MGHHRASGRLEIQATAISTSVAGRRFPAGPIAPCTAPALTYPERETNLRLPEFLANVTPVTSARSAGREDPYIYFWRTASGTSAARRAVLSDLPPICRNSIWVYTLCAKPYQGPKIFSPSNHLSQLQIVRSSPNCGLNGGALHLSLKADFRGPLSPQERTYGGAVFRVRS